MADIYSGHYTATSGDTSISDPGTAIAGGLSHAKIRYKNALVPTTTSLAATDVIRFFPLKSGDRILELLLSHPSNGSTALTGGLGVYDQVENGGAAIENDIFGGGSDFTLSSARADRFSLTALEDEDRGKPLWQLSLEGTPPITYTEDPRETWDVGIVIVTATAVVATEWLLNSVPTDPNAVTTLAHQVSTGFAIRTTWATVEPVTPGSYDWSVIDDMLDAMPTGWVATLRIGAARHVPQWIKDDLDVEVVDFWEPSTSSMESMPVPWDTDYLTYYQAFIAAVGAKYDSDARVGWVHVIGASRSTEMHLPIFDGDPDAGGSPIDWASLGYTPAALAGAYTSIFGFYNTSLPSKLWPLAVSMVLGMDDGAIEAVVDAAAGSYHDKVVAKVATYENPIVGASYVDRAFLDLKARTSSTTVIEPGKPTELPQAGLDQLNAWGANLEPYTTQLDAILESKMTTWYSPQFTNEAITSTTTGTTFNPRHRLTAGHQRARMYHTQSRINLTGLPSGEPQAGDILRMFSLSSSDRIVDMFLSWSGAAAGGALTVNLGLYNGDIDHAGGEIDKNMFVAARSITASTVRVNAFTQASILNQTDYGRELWELANVADASYDKDPQELWDVCIEFNAAVSVTAGGVGLVECRYLSVMGA
jgi:hypothetical protein